MKKVGLLISLLLSVMNTGCIATLSLGVHKDWALESGDIHNPDMKTSAELKFTNNHFLERAPLK